MGGVMGPGEALYHVLGEDFSARGIPAMRLSYRKPNDMDSCCVDTAAAVQMMVGTGCERVILMGHSFGGAVAIRVAVGLSMMVSGVVTFATQSAGCEIAGGLQGRPLLMFHGDRDENVPVQQTLAMAESLKAHGKDVETLILPGATHYFTEQEYGIALRKLFEFLRRHLNRS